MPSNPSASEPQQSLELLRHHLTLPIEPAEVWFEQVPRGAAGLGPTDQVLVAVLRFEEGALARLTANATPRPGSPPRISALANRPWLPAPVREGLAPHDAQSFTLRGRKFDAAPFLKAPYGTGYFVVLDRGGYVLVSVQTS